MVVGPGVPFPGGVRVVWRVRGHTPFDLLVPLPKRKSTQLEFASIPEEPWQRHWAGFATLARPYHFSHSTRSLYQRRCSPKPRSTRCAANAWATRIAPGRGRPAHLAQ